MAQEKIRLNKYIAQAGICSRRDADKLIDMGKVMVNGEIASMGVRVNDEDDIIVNGKKLHGRDEKVVLAYHKPVGITCTEKDKFAEKKILDEVKYPIRVTYAGRLDKESKGLILLTNDGDLINAMMRGVNRHEKEYLVRVKEEISQEFVTKMAQGLYIPDLKKTARECEVEKIGKYTFRIVLTQGLNRQIRLMCKTLGYHVTSLERIRIMNIELGSLKVGEWRHLTQEEKETLYQTCFMGKTLV